MQTRSFGVVGHRDAVVGVEELGVVVVDGARTTTSQRRDGVEVVGPESWTRDAGVVMQRRWDGEVDGASRRFSALRDRIAKCWWV